MTFLLIAALARGEKTLAHARSTDGTWLLGTRVQLVVVPPSSADVDRLPWERVEGANWDKDESLRVIRVPCVTTERCVGLLERTRHSRTAFTAELKAYFSETKAPRP